MTRRAQCAAVGGVALLGLLSLLGCGGDDARSRVPEEKEVKSPRAVAKCLQGVAGVSYAVARGRPFIQGDKDSSGLEAAVVTDVATVFFFDSTAAARKLFKLFKRGPGVYRVIGRGVIQYASEPEKRLDGDLQRCLQ